jgi:hypothetical protein
VELPDYINTTMHWRANKERLVASGALHSVFVTTADENALAALQQVREIAKSDPLIYEPLLFESWLKDVAQLADRVLAYRREGRELEVLAVKAAMDYELGQSLIAIDRETQKLLVQKPVKERAKDTQATAAVAFEKAGQTEGGFTALAQGRFAELAIEISDADQQLKLIEEKWKAQNNYQKTYWAKNNEPGNALNYAERARRVYRLLGEDLAEAYGKAIAIREGIEIVHGKRLPDLPATDPLTFIDELIFWIRATIRWAEWVSQYKVEFDLVVPLVQPWSASQTSILEPEHLRAALAKARANKSLPTLVEFQLESDLFLDCEGARLVGVGLSYGNRVGLVASSGIDKNATTDSYVRLRAIVHTPVQTADGQTYSRPPVALGSVGVFGAAPLAFEQGDLVTNVSPIGKWSIALYPCLVYKDDSEKNIGDGIEGQLMVDLKLHLRLRTWKGFKDCAHA